jgi:hypothetical protein
MLILTPVSNNCVVDACTDKARARTAWVLMMGCATVRRRPNCIVFEPSVPLGQAVMLVMVVPRTAASHRQSQALSRSTPLPLWKEIYLLACDAVVDTSLGCSGKATPVRSGRFLVWLLVMVSMVALTMLLLRLVFAQWPLLLLLLRLLSPLALLELVLVPTLSKLVMGLSRLGVSCVVSMGLDLGAKHRRDGLRSGLIVTMYTGLPPRLGAGGVVSVSLDLGA